MAGPRRKKVPTCQFFALQSLRQAVNIFIHKSTIITDNSCQIPSLLSSENNVLAGKFKHQVLLQSSNGRTFGILEHQIEERISKVQQYLFHSTPICLCSRLAEMFLNALQAWLYLNTSNEHTDLTDSIYVGIRLSEVIANDTIQNLDLSSVPKQIRSCLYGCLNKFTNVKYLNMGSGHGGWLSETFCNRFYGTGMEKFDHLVILHFHHDCTDHLLNIIAQNNHKTLKILDFSFSQNVTDSSVPALVQCELLHELDLLGSSLTIEAVTHILLKCKNLKKVNAVKLAQALEMLLQPENSSHNSNFKLELIECMPETDKCGFVTATTQKHLKILSQKCPKLKTLSVFSESDYAPLDWNNNNNNDNADHEEQMNFSFPGNYNTTTDHEINFKYLTSLHTWGGYLQSKLLAKLGSQLTELKLIHVEQITLSGALNEIFHSCLNLVKLDLQNCSIQDGDEGNNPLERRHNYSSPLSRQNNKLKHLVLVSKCSEIFMNKLLKYFTCLEILECGTSTGISDQVLESNISNLKNLKSLKVAHSKALSIYSVKLLLDHCFDLEEISDLSSFPNVTKIQLQELEIQLKSSNLDVRID